VQFLRGANRLGFFSFLPTNETLRKAEGEANKAIRLDDTNAEAHASLGLVYLFDWKWQVAERELRRAIDLNQSLAIAHGYYGMYFSSQGRVDEALAEDKLQLGLDPISQLANGSLCGMYYSAREYDQGIQQCLKQLQMYPDDALAHYTLSAHYEQKKLYEQALEQWKQAVILQGEAGLADAFGQAYAAKGWKGVLEKDIEVGRQLGNDYNPFGVAVEYAKLGEKDTAFVWLEKAYNEHHIPFYIKTEPQLDNIRSDARYADLLRRMGLPQ
jgi:tetratricopeptide (TPR) repeat protein